MIEMIYATSLNHAIGSQGGLPWGYIKSDMEWFRKHTHNKIVLMGRHTWDSIQKKLPDRINVVVSNNDFEGPDHLISGQPEHIIATLNHLYPDKDIVIIGGATLYDQFTLLADRIHITTIQHEFNGDTFFDCRLLCQLAYRLVESKHLPETDASYGIIFETFEKIIQ